MPFVKMSLRLPFTILALAGLLIRGIYTGSAYTMLPHRVIQRVGFAPEDLLDFGWRRLITSAFFTHGGSEFWLAVTMIALAVGVSEWFGGTRRIVATFWGVHLITLIAEALLIALPLKFAGAQIGAQLSHLRDVGPSAGYVGALGLACALLPRRLRLPALGAVMIGLIGFTLLPPAAGQTVAAKLSADLAHLIALPLGYLSARFWRANDRETELGITSPSAVSLAA